MEEGCPETVAPRQPLATSPQRLGKTPPWGGRTPAALRPSALCSRVLGADDAPFGPVMGKRGESGATTGAGSSSRASTTEAASASETPRRCARAVRERAGASPRVRRAVSSAASLLPHHRMAITRAWRRTTALGPKVTHKASARSGLWPRRLRILSLSSTTRQPSLVRL
jgi:hypothetical protein